VRGKRDRYNGPETEKPMGGKTIEHTISKIGSYERAGRGGTAPSLTEEVGRGITGLVEGKSHQKRGVQTWAGRYARKKKKHRTARGAWKPNYRKFK